MRGKNFHSRTSYEQQQQLRTFNKLPNLLHFVVVHVMPGNIQSHLKFSERSNTFQHEIWRVSQVLKVVSLAKKRKLYREQGKKREHSTFNLNSLIRYPSWHADASSRRTLVTISMTKVEIFAQLIFIDLQFIFSSRSFFLVFTSLLVFHFTKLNLGTSFLINIFLFTLLWNCARVECPF